MCNRLHKKGWRNNEKNVQYLIQKKCKICQIYSLVNIFKDFQTKSAVQKIISTRYFKILYRKCKKMYYIYNFFECTLRIIAYEWIDTS